MILWTENIHHSEDFVQRLEESILKNHQDDRFFFTTYNDKDCFGNSLDEELGKYIRSFYMKQTKEMMKNVGVHGYLNYKVEPNSIWVQMNNKSTDSHRIHDHHGEGAFISWVHVIKALPDQPRSFFFINSRGQKLYPKQETGDIFCFPSWALHGVEKAQVDGNRIVVAGNVSFNRPGKKDDNNNELRPKPV